MRNIFIFILYSVFLFGYTPDSYEEPYTVKKYFRKEIPIVKTPSIEAERDTFTTQDEMIDYLEKIYSRNKNNHLYYLGPTVGKRYIPVVVLSKDGAIDFQNVENGKPTVMIVAQQHGDEPMSGDVLLGTIKRLSDGDLNYLLDRINIVAIPRVNPDGAKKFTRVSGEKKDINEDHATLKTIEASTMSWVYDLFRPEVFIDIHEYIADKNSYSNIIKNSAVPYYDILTLYPTNSKYNNEMREYSKNMIEIMRKRLSESGYTSEYYYSPFQKPKNGSFLKLYEATSSSSIARNMYALKGSLSILVELRGRGIGFENVERRLNSGLISVESLLRTTYANSEDIIKFLSLKKSDKERENSDKNKVVEVRFPLIDVKTGALIQTPALLIKN